MIPASKAVFDYSTIAPELADVARAAARRIRTRLNEGYLATGHDLIDIKERIGHGQFGGWLKHEFGMTERTAENYMNAARFLMGKSETLSVLPQAVMYRLAAPSAPPAVVAEVVASAAAGIVMPVQAIREKLTTAGKAERQAAAEAAKTPERRKKENINEDRRRAREVESQKKAQQEHEEWNHERDKRAALVADWLMEKLGSDAAGHLMMLLRRTDCSRVENALSRQGRRVATHAAPVAAAAHLEAAR